MLAETIGGFWQQCRDACPTDRIHERAGQHLLAQLACSGRHTITNLLCLGNRHQHDWTADYRMYAHERLDSRAVFGVIRRELLADLSPGAPVVVAMDDSITRRSGAKVCGVAYRRDPLSPPFQTNLVRAQRVLQLAAVRQLPDNDWRTVPIGFEHMPTPAKPRHDATPAKRAEYEQARRDAAMGRCGARELARLRQSLDDDGAADRTLVGVVDGRFTVGRLLQELPPRTVLIGRLRKDASLYRLPECQAATGRHRCYGPRAPTPETLRTDPQHPYRRIKLRLRRRTFSFRVKSLAPLRWRPAGGQQNFKLLVIAPIPYARRPDGDDHYYRQPTYLLCSDPDMSDEEILRHYLGRWDIEVNFRDEKTLLGVGQAQVATLGSNQHVPALAVAAYAMLLLAAARHQAHLPLLVRPKWQRPVVARPSTTQLIQLLRHELYGQALQQWSFSGFTTTPTSNPTLQKLLPHPYPALIRTTA